LEELLVKIKNRDEMLHNLKHLFYFVHIKKRVSNGE